MNTVKKNGGFTLVELIVVIAILAILTSVAVAGYSAYIKRANNAAVEAELSNISTAAVLANAQAAGIDQIVVAADGTITVKAARFDESTEGFVSLFADSTGITLTKTNEGTEAAPVYVFKSAAGAFAADKLAKSDYSAKGATWTSAKGWEVTT